MDNQQTDRLPLPKLRLPQVSPQQGRTTLRHFVSPDTQARDTHEPAPAWPVPFSQIAQTEHVEKIDTVETATIPMAASSSLPQAASSSPSPVSGQWLSVRKLLLTCITLLIVGCIVLVLAYYLTIY